VLTGQDAIDFLNYIEDPDIPPKGREMLRRARELYDERHGCEIPSCEDIGPIPPLKTTRVKLHIRYVRRGEPSGGDE